MKRSSVQNDSYTESDGTVDSFSATPTANSQAVRLTWTCDSPEVVGFAVKRSTDGKTFAIIARTDRGGSADVVDTLIEPGQEYVYRIHPIIESKAPHAFGVVEASNWRAFSALDFSAQSTGKLPDISGTGINPVHLAFYDFWTRPFPPGIEWATNPPVPDESRCRGMARIADDAGRIIVMDIEHLPLDARRGDTGTQIAASIGQIKQIVAWAKSERPNVKIGMYSYMPLTDWNGAVKYAKARATQDNPLLQFAEQALASLRDANDLLKHLGDVMDFLAPDLYSTYNDYGDWETNATGMLQEARRVFPGKPVYPMIWPMLYNTPENKGRYSGDDYWLKQLRFVRSHADGVVIYGDHLQGYETNPWWPVAKAFLLEGTT